MILPSGFHLRKFILNSSTDTFILSKFSKEFVSAEEESAYLESTWDAFKAPPQITFLILGVMTIAFAFLDIFEGGIENLPSLILRFPVAICLLVSGYIIYRAQTFIPSYSYIVLFNQTVIALIVFFIAIAGQFTAVYWVASIIGLTLIYYHFFYNKFWFTSFASLFLGLGALLVSYFSLHLPISEFIGVAVFILSLNILGMASLRSFNGTKRGEFTAVHQLQHANDEKENLIQDLQEALAEVKTLEGLIPICANCHLIRNDGGFWERVEKYIQDRTDARFSHSICPDCLVELYPEIYKKESGPDTAVSGKNPII